MLTRTTTILAVLSLIGISGSAVASSEIETPRPQYEPGFYFGAALGPSNLDVELSDGFGNSISGDDDDVGIQGYVGYRVNRYLAAEGAYTRLGEFSGSIEDVTLEFKPQQFSASFVGSIPLENGFALHGRLGMVRWDTDVKVSQADFGSESGSFKDSGLQWALGGSFSLDNAQVRVEYQRSEIEDSEEGLTAELTGSLLSLGVVWYIG